MRARRIQHPPQYLVLVNVIGISHDGQPYPQNGLAAFDHARAKYIGEYGTLEQSLGTLFAHLSGTTFRVAGVIFFKIQNARNRLAILDRLMRLKHGDQHRLYFNSIVKATKIIDQERNEIVHWIAATIHDDGPMRVALTPPNVWDMDENTPALQVADLEVRTERCVFSARSLSMFTLQLTGNYQLPPPWPDIFLKPAEYPPPDTHPLSPNFVAPPSPPEPSQG